MEPIANRTGPEAGRSGSASSEVAARLEIIIDMDVASLRAEWRRLYRSHPPKGLSRDLMIRAIAYKTQERALGGLGKATLRKLSSLARKLEAEGARSFNPRPSIKAGTGLVREWGGETHSVQVLEGGFEYRGHVPGRVDHRAFPGIEVPQKVNEIRHRTQGQLFEVEVHARGR